MKNIQFAQWFRTERKGCILIESNLLLSALTEDDEQDKLPIISERLSTAIHIIFPSFILKFMDEGFTHRIKTFLDASLPIGINSKLYSADATDLESLIPAFAYCHNAMVYLDTSEIKNKEKRDKIKKKHQSEIKESCNNLIDQLMKLKPITNE